MSEPREPSNWETFFKENMPSEPEFSEQTFEQFIKSALAKADIIALAEATQHGLFADFLGNYRRFLKMWLGGLVDYLPKYPRTINNQ